MRARVFTRAVLDAFKSTKYLLQSPMLGLDNMISGETALKMWTHLLQACISVSIFLFRYCESVLLCTGGCLCCI